MKINYQNSMLLSRNNNIGFKQKAKVSPTTEKLCKQCREKVNPKWTGSYSIPMSPAKKSIFYEEMSRLNELADKVTREQMVAEYKAAHDPDAMPFNV